MLGPEVPELDRGAGQRAGAGRDEWSRWQSAEAEEAGGMIGLSIDPGKNNGICLFHYDEGGFGIVKLWQFLGGAERLHQWLNGHDFDTDGGLWMRLDDELIHLDALVVEKFTPHDNEGFSLTLDSVEPLVGEGVLIAHDLKPFITWRQPSQQYFMGDPRNDLKTKKRLAKEFLETNNLLPKGVEFAYKDANDAISATLHAISWLRKVKHGPTLDQLFPESRG
jgi:hypothetical protein